MSEARGSGSWLAVAMEERPPAEQEPQPVKPANPVKNEPIPGFYAGTSRGEPPVGRGRRKGALVVGAVVAVAAGVALVASMGKGGGETAAGTTEPDPAPIADTEPEPATETEPGPQAPTGDPADEAEPADEEPTTDTTVDEATSPSSDVRASEVVEVVDEGWYVNDDLGSYGFVVENTSDSLLGSFLVRVKGYDQSGHVISGIDSWKHVIGTMQPGQRVAVAEQMNSEVELGGGIGRLEFTITELSEGTEATEEVPQGSVQVGEIDRTANSVRTTVSYKVWSSYRIALDANVYVVFRDGSGEIVGGASSFVDLPADGSNSGDFDLPAGIVSPAVESTEVHVVPRLPL